MYESLYAGLQFHKGAVVREAHHPAGDAGAQGILLFRQAPGVGAELLQTQGDAFLFPVEAQNLDGDGVPDLKRSAGWRTRP